MSTINNGAFSNFIRTYTETQYKLRYKESLPENLLNQASNKIAITFGQLVENNDGKLPTLENIGIVDGGAAASEIFTDSKYYKYGEYTAWAGVILFPFLGYDNFYSDWLLNYSSVTGTLIDETTKKQIVIKHESGTYALFSALSSNIQTVHSLSKSEIATLAASRFFLVDSEQDELIEETNYFINLIYGIPEDNPFDFENISPYSITTPFGKTGVIVGSLKDDDYKTFSVSDENNPANDWIYSQFTRYAIHAGQGDDFIDANINGNLSNNVPTLDLIIDGGNGNDTVTYGKTKAELSIVVDNTAYNNTTIYEVNKYDLSGHKYAKDYVYLVEHLIGTSNDDIVTIKSKPYLSPKTTELLTIDLGGYHYFGNTLNWSLPEQKNIWIYMDVRVPFMYGAGDLQISNFQNVITSSGNDVIHGNDQNNIIAPGGGNNVVSGGRGDDIFVAARGELKIKDADAGDKLYIPFTSINPITENKMLAIEIKGGLALINSPQSIGQNVAMDGSFPAVLYPSYIDGWKFIPESLAEPINTMIESPFYVQFLKIGSDLNIKVMIKDDETSESSDTSYGSINITVENYEPGDLGLNFVEFFEPDISDSPTLPGGYDPNFHVPMYYSLTKSMFEFQELPYSDGLWYG
ncbi:hypothetical protein [Dickeya chrysanthemi]|uniref:hypothetical protein n=1 Tax=Dickeya chrysanthemi TaxID=556 RepID=UPI00039F4D3D|nr:hypothetical protein [Dickeya chrysanthemi]